jgi:NADH-quinone oxidoreductase subunit E
MPIDEQTRAEAQVLARRYPIARAALLPMLHLVQSVDGYVSEDGIALCAEVLGITKAEVASVSTFYTMYKREQVGDWLLSVCTNPTCQIAGGQAIYDGYVEALGGHHDGEHGVTVEHAECLGVCGDAPIVQVNYEMFGRLSHAEGMALLEAARKGEPPVSPLSGVRPCTFREVERELSGIDDGVDAQLAEAAALQAASANPPAWRSGETHIPGSHPGGDPAGPGGEAFRAAAGLMIDQSPAGSSAGPAGTEAGA